MAYVVKVKLSDVEKALAEMRPGHRLVAVHAYVGCPDDEYADWKKEDDMKRPTPPGVIRLHSDPPTYEMRDLYFDER